MAVIAKPKEPTPPPPKPVIPPKPCLLCKRFEPKTALFQCDNCTISYHAACYGIDTDWEWPHDEWLCNLCERDQTRTRLNLHPHCILCPPPASDFDLKSPLTALDCLKPTELQKCVLLAVVPSAVSPRSRADQVGKRVAATCTTCAPSGTASSSLGTRRRSSRSSRLPTSRSSAATTCATVLDQPFCPSQLSD